MITLKYILPNYDMLGGSSELLKGEPHYVTKLTTAYGAGTCSLHVLSLLTEELQNVLHWQQYIPALLYEEIQSVIYWYQRTEREQAPFIILVL